MYSTWRMVRENAGLLLIGAALGLFAANLFPAEYLALKDFVLWDHAPIGHAHDGYRTLTVHYLVNDVLMALFFAIAGKEVFEALALRDGSLRGRTALTPLFATAGGIMGPIAVYLAIAASFGSTTFAALSQGWAIPTATDIAFSYLVGRIVFGANHPAVRFLLLLAIADDAIGLIILAVFYPTGDLAPAWLLLSFGVAGLTFFAFNWLPRYRDWTSGTKVASATVRARFGYWPYVVAGAVSWYGFAMSGIHPALGLLPIIPAIPHADHDFGIFAEAETREPDLLNQLEHQLKLPVEFILFCFGLLNAGVALTAVGPGTMAVLGGLLIGKPLGIFAFGMLAAYVFRLGLPIGMRPRDLLVLGFVAAIGFTVALFVAGVAFPAGELQDEAKMGALLSFGAALPAVVLGFMLRVRHRAPRLVTA